jgi:hypothetical protein
MPAQFENADKRFEPQEQRDSQRGSTLAADLEGRESLVKTQINEQKQEQALPKDDLFDTPLFPDLTLHTEPERSPTEQQSTAGKSIRLGEADYAIDQILAKAPEQVQILDMRDDCRVPGGEVVQRADELGDHPTRWKQSPESPSPKCNLFVNAVLKDCGVAMPWDSEKPPDVQGMDKHLATEAQKPDGNWECVYSYDSKHDKQSRESFPTMKAHDGDVAIWNNPQTVHAGILTAGNEILYAGSESEKARNGFRRGPITDFTLDPQYSVPDHVFRSKQVR